MSGPLATYRFVNAKLRSRISKILPREFTDRLIRSASLSEAVLLLRETDFGDSAEVFNRTGDLKMVELELYRREIRILTDVGKYLKGREAAFCAALSLRYEVDNLKNALRLWFDRAVRGRSVQDVVGYLYRGRIVHPLDYDRIVNADSLAEIVELTDATPYAQIIGGAAAKFDEAKSVFDWEMALDRYYYMHLVKEAKTLAARDREIALRMIGVEIDIMNIHWILRLRTYQDMGAEKAAQFMIPHGGLMNREMIEAFAGSPTDGMAALLKGRFDSLRPLLSSEASDTPSRLAMMERVLEEIMALEIRRILVGYPFTIGIALAYFLLKRSEIRKVMTILNAKYYSLSQERIESVL